MTLKEFMKTWKVSERDIKKIAEGFDAVNRPPHYVKGGMECIDFIRAIVSDLTPYEAYCLGNVVKYL